MTRTAVTLYSREAPKQRWSLGGGEGSRGSRASSPEAVLPARVRAAQDVLGEEMLPAPAPSEPVGDLLLNSLGVGYS